MNSPARKQITLRLNDRTYQLAKQKASKLGIPINSFIQMTLAINLGFADEQTSINMTQPKVSREGGLTEAELLV